MGAANSMEAPQPSWAADSCLLKPLTLLLIPPPSPKYLFISLVFLLSFTLIIK
jgi:hypothetical protein